jgi:hypothetical protein
MQSRQASLPELVLEQALLMHHVCRPGWVDDNVCSVLVSFRNNHAAKHRCPGDGLPGWTSEHPPAATAQDVSVSSPLCNKQHGVLCDFTAAIRKR